jgi:tetratricopeptide (TPR) repeat protein
VRIVLVGENGGKSMTINRKLLAACIVAATATPAAASVMVLGSSDARLCYEAADSPAMPLTSDMRRCDNALSNEGLSQYEMVATHVNRGILRLRRNMMDDAVADFDAAIAIDPNQPEAYLNKGAALIRRESPQEALQLFTVALEHNTSRPAVAHYGRAVANEVLGNVAAAYRDYQAASTLAPNWAEPRNELARFRVTSR